MKPITSTTAIIILVILCSFQSQLVLCGKSLTTASDTSIRIAFGSCLKPDLKPDLVLNSITKSNPDVFVWLGDVAYTDTTIIGIPLLSLGLNQFSGEDIYRTKLEKTKNLPSYQRLRKKTQIVGVWDDHDYGINDGTAAFEYKEITQPIWLDFIDEPADSPRRKQKGIWDSYYIGKELKVKLILLDTRYYRNGRFFGNDTLGEIQWKWLENELINNKAELLLIASGYQVLPDDRFIPETWFYESRERLYNLMNKYRVNGVVLMSGDVHTGEIMHNPCSKERVGYDLYEITSSGMTHHIPRRDIYFYESWIPPTYDRPQHTYKNLNFGTIDINLVHGHVMNVSLQIRNKTGDIVRRIIIPYSSLLRNETRIGGHENCLIYAKSPLRRWIEYQITHYSNITTVEGRRAVILHSVLVGVLLIAWSFLYLFARVCCCCIRKRAVEKKREKLQ